MRKILSLFLLLIIVGGLSAQDSKGEFQIIGEHINVSNISRNGKYTIAFGSQGPSYVWTKEEGLVQVDDISEGSRCYDISDNGIMVGTFNDWNYKYIEGGVEKPLVNAGYLDIKEGVWHSLGLKEGLPIGPISGSTALSINSDGTIIGGNWYREENVMAAVKWINYEVSELNSNDIYAAKVTAMSGDGSIMGGWIQPASNRMPVVWINGVMKEITYAGQKYPGEISRISENGKYAAMHLILDNGAQPTMYDIEKDEVTLVELPPETMNGFSLGVSNDGIVVGYLAIGFGPWAINKAFIYSHTNGTYLIEDYLAALGIEYPNNIAINRAEAISADGSRISGNGNINGYTPGGWTIEITEHKNGFNPPQNVEATENGPGNITLTWEAPNPDSSHWLRGYNVYRNGVKLNSSLITEITGLIYEDTNLANGTYNYQVTSVWEENEEESRLTAEVKVNTGKVIPPFFDDFSSESFDTNLWDLETSTATYWIISVISGIKEPATAFVAPKNTAYTGTLKTPYIDVANVSDLYLSFNLAPLFIDETHDKHTLKIEIFDGESWSKIKEYQLKSYSSNGFRYEKINISSYASNSQIRIRFIAEGESDGFYAGWNVDNIMIYESKDETPADMPLNLHVVRKEDGKVALSWTDPNETAKLTYFAEDMYSDLVGNLGEPVIFANLFEKEDLKAYEGYKMVSIGAYFTTWTPDDLARYKLVVFEGEEKVLDQEIVSYKSNSFNIIELDEPLTINTDKPLYFGIEITYHNRSDRPLGLSPIDEVDGKSNLFSKDGGKTWIPLTKAETKIKKSLCIRANIAKEVDLTPRDGILGYAVYRDGVPLYGAGIVNPLNQFIDMNAPVRECCYQVSAFYYVIQEESKKTEKICAPAWQPSAIKDVVDTEGIEIYPNPVIDMLKISGEFNSATLINVNGETLQVTSEKNIDMMGYPSGIYLLKLDTGKGEIIRKISKQ